MPNSWYFDSKITKILFFEAQLLLNFDSCFSPDIGKLIKGFIDKNKRQHRNMSILSNKNFELFNYAHKNFESIPELSTTPYGSLGWSDSVTHLFG